jgi:PAS domain S-box-containing protein
MFGYEMDELLSMSVSDLYADPSARKGFLEAMRSSGEISRYEVEFRRSDGSTFTGALSARATLSDTGEVEFMDGILEDFTELKQAQDSMRKSERKYRQLVEQSQGIVVIQDGSIVFANRAFAEVSGYPVDELLAMPPDRVQELVVPEDREMVWGRLQARLKGEDVPASYEFRGARKNGQVRWLQIFSQAVEHEGAPAIQGVFLDVTDKKRAEDALRSSEREKETILSSLVEHVVHEDTEMRVMWANRAACESVGMIREELIGSFCYEIWAQRDDPCPDCPVIRAMETREPQQTEKTTPDGRSWYIRGYPVENDEGDVVGGIEVTLEMTEQKKAEEAYETERTHLESLFESAPEAIAMADVQSRMIRANPEFLRLFGYTQEEVMGKPIDDLIVPPDRIDEAKGLTKAAASGEYVAMETVRMTKDGTLLNVSVLGAPVFVKDEQIGVYGIYRDITDSKRAERALRESEERYRALTEESLAGVYLLNEDRFLFVNSEMARITGYSREELLAIEDVGRIIHPDDLSMTKERGAARERGETVQPRYELRLITKSGKVKNLMVATRQVPYEGKTVVLGNLFDITDKVRAEKERREFEAKLWQAQKLESLGVLAGGIAHDFNNLLMAIMGNVDLAMDSIPEQSQAVANLREIGSAAQSAADLCSQMLAYSGKGTIERGQVDLHQLILEMASLLEVSIHKDIKLEFDLSDQCRLLQADVSQMRQVVMNLIINASEAIGEHVGMIRISTGIRRCDADFLKGTLLGKDLPEGDYVYLEVADSGRGMDEETTKKMFDPFFSTKFAGRGLGLAAVLGIVRRHHGTINVSSEVGGGTRFTVFFPPGEKVAEPEPEPIDEEESWSGEGRTVLLVDDEELVLNVGKRILERAGFEVEAAADGLEALEISRRRGKEISVVILDLTMPRMAGNETYVELRKIYPEVPVILSTGHSTEDVTQRFDHQMDISGVLHKPYTVPQLLNLLKEVLEGRS